jgi:hypothetical protein
LLHSKETNIKTYKIHKHGEKTAIGITGDTELRKYIGELIKPLKEGDAITLTISVSARLQLMVVAEDPK